MLKKMTVWLMDDISDGCGDDYATADLVISPDGRIIKSRYSALPEYTYNKYWFKRCRGAESKIRELEAQIDDRPEHKKTGILPDGEYTGIWYQDQLQVLFDDDGYNFCTDNDYSDVMTPCKISTVDGVLSWWSVYSNDV
jgi:hypothetical protein